MSWTLGVLGDYKRLRMSRSLSVVMNPTVSHKFHLPELMDYGFVTHPLNSLLWLTSNSRLSSYLYCSTLQYIALAMVGIILCMIDLKFSLIFVLLPKQLGLFTTQNQIFSIKQSIEFENGISDTIPSTLIFEKLIYLNQIGRHWLQTNLILHPFFFWYSHICIFAHNHIFTIR